VLRSWTYTPIWISCLVLAFGGGVSAQESRLSDTLLPATTQGFLAISNVDALSEHWHKTQLGHLMDDPMMEPFSKDLHRQFEERWSAIHERLGLTLDDMRSIPGGDAGIGLIAPKPGDAILAIVVDVTGKLQEAQELLKKASENQLQRGAKRHEVKFKDSPDPIIQFDLPEQAALQEAAPSTLKGSAKSEAAKVEAAKKTTTAGTAPAAQEKPARKAFYCLTGNLLVVTDNLEIMQGILERAANSRKDSLANDKAYQAVSSRCKADAPEGMPQIRWFLRPVGYAEAVRAATPPEDRRKGKSILEIMRTQGVSVIEGVGGFVDFWAEDREMVHRTAVYAPGTREKAMKILVLPNEKEYAPQPWAPREIATYVTFYIDVLNAFNNVDSLVDEFLGQGEQGTWREILLGLEKDPNGPQINIEKELVQHLGHRVSMLTDYQLPITTSSERLLFTIDTSDPKAVMAGLEKFHKDSPTFKRREIDGQVIWESVEDETPEPEAPVISVPSFGEEAVVNPQPPQEKDEDEESAPRLMPHMAMTVWKDHLIIASHIDFLLKVIRPEGQLQPLASDADYQLVHSEIENMTPSERCAQAFSRTDEAYRPTYELIRQNKMPESDSMFARLLNAVFGEGKKGSTRQQKIDGSQLPEYPMVRQYLGPAGFQATTEKDGWFLKGFTLSKKAEEEKK